MTHSGGKPHTNVGDRGQRYEVRATGYPREGESVIGVPIEYDDSKGSGGVLWSVDLARDKNSN